MTTEITYANEWLLDLHDSGYWMARWHDTIYPIGTDKEFALLLIDKLNKAHRPNLELINGNLCVCWNSHAKGNECEYEVLVENAYGRTL